MDWDFFSFKYHINNPQENGKNEIYMDQGQPLVFKKLVFKPQKVEIILRTTNANVKQACFYINIIEITPLKTGTTKVYQNGSS